MNRRHVAILMGLVLGISAFAGALNDTAEPPSDNLSDGRTLGVGIQVDFPWGGLISARYWLSSVLGTEGVLFLWGDQTGLEGSASLRALVRTVDAPVVDFYVAAGATVPFSSYSGTETILSVVGGIEFSVRFARNLAWNIEFGGSYSTYGHIQMVLGAGIHFYF